MKIEYARQVLSDVIDLRRRFGHHVSTRDFNKDDLLDALVVLSEHNEEVSSKEVIKLKQQLGAAQSREKKGVKRRESLDAEIKDLKKEIKELRTVLNKRTADLEAVEAELHVIKQAAADSET